MTAASPRALVRAQVALESFRLSPDGTFVVYALRRVVGDEYRSHLHVRPVRGGRARQLTRGRVRDGGPTISPDGRQLAFVRTPIGVDDALAQARAVSSLNGMDLAKEVSVRAPYPWRNGTYDLDAAAFRKPMTRFKVIAYDYGVKLNILRLLVESGCELTVVPARTPAREVLALKPDGVFLANGPGDPAACDYAIAATREFVDARIPLFGICLGHQLMGLALGAKTVEYSPVP